MAPWLSSGRIPCPPPGERDEVPCGSGVAPLPWSLWSPWLGLVLVSNVPLKRWTVSRPASSSTSIHPSSSAVAAGGLDLFVWWEVDWLLTRHSIHTHTRRDARRKARVGLYWFSAGIYPSRPGQTRPVGLTSRSDQTRKQGPKLKGTLACVSLLAFFFSLLVALPELAASPSSTVCKAHAGANRSRSSSRSSQKYVHVPERNRNWALLSIE